MAALARKVAGSNSLHASDSAFVASSKQAFLFHCVIHRTCTSYSGTNQHFDDSKLGYVDGNGDCTPGCDSIFMEVFRGDN